MPTNDERREVAVRLREEGSLRTFAEAVGFSWEDDTDWRWCDVAVKYADLIEPEPERTCSPVEPFDSKTKHIVERGSNHYYWPYKGCPECQSDFPQGSNYCSNCGARVKEDER